MRFERIEMQRLVSPVVGTYILTHKDGVRT
jgi:hypothetical protein